MKIGEVYERKDRQYKILAKVLNENNDYQERYVYLVAARRFGEDTIDYISSEMEYTEPAFTKTNHWLG